MSSHHTPAPFLTTVPELLEETASGRAGRSWLHQSMEGTVDAVGGSIHESKSICHGLFTAMQVGRQGAASEVGWVVTLKDQPPTSASQTPCPQGAMASPGRETGDQVFKT